MTPKTKTRIVFDFDGDLNGSLERLEQIICSSYWASGLNVVTDERYALLAKFVKLGVIIIDECEYELSIPSPDSKDVGLLTDLLGKHHASRDIQDMAVVFVGEPFESAAHYRNTVYLPKLKAYVRADGMKPENIAEMLASDECDKIIIFPMYPLDEKIAYYELSLAGSKEKFADVMKLIEEETNNKLFEAVRQADERSKAGYKATLRLEKKADRDTVERITYRAFCNAPPTGADDDGMEALLARKLRTCTAFVPELDYVAELDGTIIGNIMYTRSKVVGDNAEWDTLTFGPVSVLPKFQRDGVGTALIRKTLEVARELGYRAVLIFGHETYYPRFGFKPASEYGITTADGKNFPAFMALPLFDGTFDGVHGRLVYDEVYNTLDKAESDALNAKLATPMDIDEYIKAQPLYVQQFLRQVRGAIRAAAPGTTEKISWQMPTFWRGKILIHFAAFKKHIGIYPGAEAMEHFAPRLYRYKTSKGAIQFPYQTFDDEQLTFISAIAAWCAEHNAK
jgi:predicted N-acetyltransferase YhbS/uncharacterized protein YdhG (YjbR/CyaY superfamily)